MSAALLVALLLFLAQVLQHASSGASLSEPSPLDLSATRSGRRSLEESAGGDGAGATLGTNETLPLAGFTGWSDWSVCDRHCSQTRIRRCRAREECGQTLIREERRCGYAQRKERARCGRRRRARRGQRRFRVVEIPEKAQPRHGRNGRNDDPDEYYGKWSRWSACTRSCTTQRHRWCRLPGLCWRDVVRQSAYCYIEGSYCQKWIRRQMRQRDDPGNDLPDSANSTREESWRCGVAATDTRLSHFKRIIGGRPSTPGSWPWQVAILNRYREAFCGGTLVSARWVLTAAHCVRKRLSVRVGEYNLLVREGPEIELKVEHSVIHPKYNAHTVDNDIALLRLPVALSASETRGVACLPAPRQQLPSDQLCTIIGWGKTNASHEFGTDVLHEAQIPVVADEICRRVYADYKITSNMFCAGYRRGRMDSCAGDSGGPLLCRDPQAKDRPWTVFGVTSFGEGCGKRGKYGIYARLSNYVHWISKVIRHSADL